MHLLEIISLLLVALVFAAPFIWIEKPKAKITKLLTAFSGAYVIGIVFTHIIPEAYEFNTRFAGIAFLVGFVIQIILEMFSGGIEHGHVHYHNKGKFPYVIVASLFIHALIEGLSINDHIHDIAEDTYYSLLYGILLHKIPVSIVFVSLVLKASVGKTKTFFLLLIFSLLSPIGSILSDVIFIDAKYLSIPLGITAGILIHVSTTILFETSESHKFNIYKFSIILIGFILALFS